jgi:hypothetical protein
VPYFENQSIFNKLSSSLKLCHSILCLHNLISFAPNSIQFIKIPTLRLDSTSFVPRIYFSISTGHALFPLKIKSGIFRIGPWKELLHVEPRKLCLALLNFCKQEKKKKKKKKNQKDDIFGEDAIVLKLRNFVKFVLRLEHLKDWLWDLDYLQ